MNKKERQKYIDDHHRKMEVNGILETQNRARSVTVGTCFGGTVELSMRRHDGTITFAILQPVEAIELLNQIAAGVGCHIHIQPRRDFASWRNWREDDPSSLNDPLRVANLRNLGLQQAQEQSLPPPEQQPGLQPAMMARSDSNEQTMATQKTVGRKRVKRAAAAA